MPSTKSAIVIFVMSWLLVGGCLAGTSDKNGEKRKITGIKDLNFVQFIFLYFILCAFSSLLRPIAPFLICFCLIVPKGSDFVYNFLFNKLSY